jgi:hypothetical protein
MQVLQIISTSWPIAMMFLGTIVGGIVIYLIRWFKQADREDKAYRASQALVVRERE